MASRPVTPNRLNRETITLSDREASRRTRAEPPFCAAADPIPTRTLAAQIGLYWGILRAHVPAGQGSLVYSWGPGPALACVAVWGSRELARPVRRM